MATIYNEGFKPVLDHLDVKNRESVAAWEERLWQQHMNSDIVDFRDEHGKERFSKYAAMLGNLRHIARKLQRNNRSDR